MKNLIGMVEDYNANIPLHMLENKYGIPIHKIINVLHSLIAESKKPKQRVNCSRLQLETLK